MNYSIKCSPAWDGINSIFESETCFLNFVHFVSYHLQKRGTWPDKTWPGLRAGWFRSNSIHTVGFAWVLHNEHLLLVDQSLIVVLETPSILCLFAVLHSILGIIMATRSNAESLVLPLNIVCLLCPKPSCVWGSPCCLYMSTQLQSSSCLCSGAAFLMSSQVGAMLLANAAFILRCKLLDAPIGLNKMKYVFKT